MYFLKIYFYIAVECKYTWEVGEIFVNNYSQDSKQILLG